jgi:GNAT superfamily N-acetyltransferase
MNITLRKAGSSDIALLVTLRLDALREIGGALSEENREHLRRVLPLYFERHLADNTFIAILAEVNGEVVSAAYLAIAENPPNPAFANGLIGTVLNVLTYPQHRRRGYASAVMGRLIDEARRLDVAVLQLSATADGQPMYEKLGFAAQEHETYMRKPLL